MVTLCRVFRVEATDGGRSAAVPAATFGGAGIRIVFVHVSLT